MAKAQTLSYLQGRVPNRINAYLIILVRLNEFYQWETFVDQPERIEELHNMRIAAKRLRYTLEIFDNVLPPENEALLEELTQLQDELGAIHDSDVRSALLRICLRAVKNTKGEESLEELQERYGLSDALVKDILDPAVEPSEKEKRGLALFLEEIQCERLDQYAQFRRHWSQFQAQDFRGRVLALFNG